MPLKNYEQKLLADVFLNILIFKINAQRLNQK